MTRTGAPLARRRWPLDFRKCLSEALDPPCYVGGGLCLCVTRAREAIVALDRRALAFPSISRKGHLRTDSAAPSAPL